MMSYTSSVSATEQIEKGFCPITLRKNPSLGYVNAENAFTLDIPSDPNFFTNFGRTSRREYLRQFKLAQSLVGKTIEGFPLLESQSRVIIEGISTRNEAQFKLGGMNLNIKSENLHTTASLRKILIYARRIPGWEPVEIAGKSLPVLKLERTVPLELRTISEGADDRLLGLTELSRDSHLTLAKYDIFVRQKNRLLSSEKSPIGFVFYVIHQLGGDIRVVEARSALTAKRIKQFVHVASDERGRKVLLLSADLLASNSKGAADLGYRIYSKIYDGWLIETITDWIRRNFGTEKAFEFIMGDDPSETVLKLLRVGAAPLSTESFFAGLSEVSAARLKNTSFGLRSLGRVTENSTDFALFAMQESLKLKGGRIEVVELFDRETGATISQTGAQFLTGTRGEPIILVTPQTLKEFLYLSWTQYLESAFKIPMKRPM